MDPVISIIIPTYNRIDLISQTLNSVLAQTYSNWQCVIIDDGSTDKSIDVIQKYLDLDSRFLYLSRPTYKEKGPSSCRNYGIENSTGDYIIFLDSDDLLAPTCLENRIKFVLENLEYDFWIFKMAAFKNSIEKIEFVYENINVEDESLFCKKEFMKGMNPFVVTGPLWKKNILIESTGFNEQMTMIEDPEFHLRILKKGYKLKFANFENPDSFYRQRLVKNEKRSEKEVKNNYIFFKIHLDRKEPNTVFYFRKMFNILMFEELDLKYFFSFSFLGLKRNIFTIKNIFYSVIIIFYNVTRLSNLKGLGYNYFKTEFNNF